MAATPGGCSASMRLSSTKLSRVVCPLETLRQSSRGLGVGGRGGWRGGEKGEERVGEETHRGFEKGVGGKGVGEGGRGEGVGGGKEEQGEVWGWAIGGEGKKGEGGEKRVSKGAGVGVGEG